MPGQGERVFLFLSPLRVTSLLVNGRCRGRAESREAAASRSSAEVPEPHLPGFPTAPAPGQSLQLPWTPGGSIHGLFPGKDN